MSESAREAARAEYEKWTSSLPQCPDICDGDLVGEEHDDDCPVGQAGGFATYEDAYVAGWQAAIDRHFPGYQEWISVEERLPDEGDWVMACFLKDERVIAVYCDGVWYRIIDQFQLPEVTHWMPLPDPPVARAATVGQGIDYFTRKREAIRSEAEKHMDEW
jgi:(2Fe-2S) ferredoxin